MVFKVQDGIEFSTRAEWRNYMMLTYYSFHDVKNSPQPLVKHPGSINGQMFDIINCENSELIILDSCEQVQIDHVKNCRIFIGASTSTVFIRNCQDCTIYSCCKQLRIRECVNCINYVYSPSEVHIEESSGLEFACFRGGYPEHEAHLRESNLYPPENNFWHSVYDHNPTGEGSPNNWKLLPAEECAEWFPVGYCDPVVPQTTAATTTGVSNSHQVGEAFGIEQMKADDEKNRKDKNTVTSSTLSTSVVSTKEVISHDRTTSHKELTVEQMIQGEAKKQDKHVTLNVPTARETSAPTTPPLAGQPVSSHPPAMTPIPKSYMSDEDELKVNQLGIEIALLVASARAKGIDVSVWLSESPENKVVPVSDFNSRFISLGLAVGIQEDFETKREIDFATAAQSLAFIATICSGGYDPLGVPLLDVHKFLLIAQAKVDRFLAQGQSVDVEVEEDIEEEVEVEEEEIPEPIELTVTESTPEVEVEPPAEEKEETPPPTPTISTSVEEPIPQKKRQLSISLRSTSAPPRQRKSTPGSDSGQALLLRSSARQSLSATTLEELLMATLKQPDLYHVIQVHLGYIKPYIMNLARGSVVVSSPRRWISIYDIEKAFSAARLHLSTSQIHAIMQNVKEFATKTGLDPIRTIDNEKEQDALEEAFTTNSVVLKQRVSAVWLKRYLIHLKLGESACDWVTWLDQKLSSKNYRYGMKMSTADRSKEFRKALAGLPHTLDENEVSHLLQSFEILSPEILQQVVQHRLDNWELDTAGRRDFHHSVNVAFKKWTKEDANVAAMAGKSANAKKEMEKNAKKDIKRNLLTSRKQELLLSEKKKAAITIDVFLKFDSENKKDNYTSSKKFGDWLEKHLYNENQHLSRFREDVRNRNKSFGARQVKDTWLGPMNFIESLATKVIQSLKSPLQHERRKSLIALRRQLLNESRGAKESSDAQYLLVSRKIFTNFFDDLFLKQIEDQLSRETQGQETKIFFKSKDDAIKCAHDFDKEYSKQQSQQFQEWLEQKNEQKKLEATKLDKENQQKEKEENKKSTQAKKAYKKWLKLHKKDKYYSKSDRKAKDIPEVLRASHNQAWRKELPDPFPEENVI